MTKKEQREKLKWALGQVERTEKHISELERRLERINEEKETPIGSAGYSPLPRSTGKGSGAASILLLLSDIEERIYDQKEELEKSVIRTMEIIEFIPLHSTARRIFELRHIDCMRWEDVAAAIPMARSNCARHYNEALDKLLQYQKIQDIIGRQQD